MNDTLAVWKYTDRVNDERRSALAEPGSYENLVSLVRDDVTNITVREEPGRDVGLTDCVQPVFSFELPRHGDAFFNGPWGYRAQYLAGAAQGLAANSLLLSTLAPTLLASLDTRKQPGLSKIDLCASLHAASAKIWIQEILSLLRDPTVDLDVDRWILEAKKGVELAKWGLSAPQVTKFEVKGALLDPYGNEVVPIRKIRRHYDIHHYGFS